MPEKKTDSAMASPSSVMVDRPGNRVEEDDVAGLSNSQGSADAVDSTTPESLHTREKNAGNGASPDKSENADRNNGNKQVESSNSCTTAETIAIDAAEEAAGENHGTTFTKLPPATALSISSSSSVEGNDENDVVDLEKANERPVSKGTHTTEAAGVSPPSVGSGDGDNDEQQAQTQQTPSHDGRTASTTAGGHHGMNGSSSTTTNGTYHHQYHPQQHHPSSYRGSGGRGRGGGGRGYYRGGDPMMNGGGRFGPGGRGMNGGYGGGGRGGDYYQPHPHHLPLHGAPLYKGPPPVGGPGGGMNNPAAIQNAAAGLASSAMGFFHTQQQLLPTPLGLTVRANLMKMNAQEAREYLAAMAVQQIEYHFTAESLRRDRFLRSNLDEAGYVPLAMVCNFPTVASFAADYYEIINTLKDSLLLDYDEENETIRLKENPTAWLAPNQHGSRGAPRWVKTKTSRPSNIPAMDVQPLPPPLPQQVQRHPPPSLPYHHHHHGGYNNGFQRGAMPPPLPSPRHSNTSTTNDHHHDDEKASHEKGKGGGEEGEGAENGLAEATSEMKKLMHDEHNDVSTCKTEAAVVEGGKDRRKQGGGEGGVA